MPPRSRDIDVFGNGRLISRTIQPGDVAKSKPTRCDLIEIEVKALLVDSVDHVGQGLRCFRLGEGDECDALECVAPLMHPGEICAIRSFPLAFGLEMELCKARPGAIVEAVVQLHRVQKVPPVEDKQLSERLSEAKKKKIRGNWLFGRDELQAAAASFSLGLGYIRESCHQHVAQRAQQAESGKEESNTDIVTSVGNEEVLQEAIALCCSLYTNLALVQLKLPEQISHAVNTCNAALMLQPYSVKAMYLRAKALLAATEVSEEARRDAVTTLECALKNAPDNQEARALLDTAQSGLNTAGESSGILRTQTNTWLWIVISGVFAWLVAEFAKRYEIPILPVPSSDGGEKYMLGDDVTVSMMDS
jgi:hypothetical protein